MFLIILYALSRLPRSFRGSKPAAYYAKLLVSWCRAIIALESPKGWIPEGGHLDYGLVELLLGFGHH